MARGLRGHDHELNFKQLCNTFAEICPDFRHGPGQKREMESLDFANRVLFELGPQMRELKQSGRDQMWRLVFNGGGNVYIYTYTFQKPLSGQPRLGGGKLYLTLRQAGLLAVSKVCQLIPAQQNPREKILLTPLARCIFEPQNIPKIAFALATQLGRPVNPGDVLRTVISSCQSGGFHLKHSQSHVALVAIGVTTQNAADRKKQRRKILKQYSEFGKVFDAQQYKIYSKFSRMSDLVSAEAPVPEPDPPKQQPAKGKPSVSAVLRSIAKSVDDPLTGGTVEMKCVAQPNPENRTLVETMPASVNIRLQATSLENIKSKQLAPRKPYA